jgi:hypothetical protein
MDFLWSFKNLKKNAWLLGHSSYFNIYAVLFPEDLPIENGVEIPS